MKICLATPTNYKRLLEYFGAKSELALDTETTGLDYLNDKIVGISIADENYSCYFPLRHKTGNVNFAYVKEWLLEKSRLDWVYHNSKFDWQMCYMDFGIDLKINHDTMIMAHLTDVNRSRRKQLKLKSLMVKVLKWKNVEEYEDIFGDKKLAELCPEEVYKYACKDSAATILLKKKWEEDIEKYAGIYKVEIELVKVVARMEIRGVTIDTEGLENLSGEYKKSLPGMLSDIYSIIGEVDINSTKKLSASLLNHGIPLTNKTEKSKQYKLDKAILERFAPQFPVCDKILEYRKQTKLHSTFVMNLHDYVNTYDCRLHAGFLQVNTCSGRFSSKKPNMQNLPADKKSKIRGFIRATDGFKLLSIDYSQIEVRILLALAESPLIKDLQHGVDIHTWMAGIIFGKDLDKVNEEQRRYAKTVTFGLAYGMTEYGLARRLNISVEQAEQIRTLYFNKIVGVKQFIERTHEFVRTHGYVTTCGGRKRRIPEVYSKDQKIREYGYRASVNTRIQGTAADVLKIAMVKAQKYIDKNYPKDIFIVLTVHDEIDFELRETLDILKVTRELQKQMEMEVMGVLLTSDAEIGDNWGALKKI